MRYRLVVRVTAADVGQRVTIRWRPPELEGSQLMTDVLGILEEADDEFFKVRRGRDGQLIVIPRERAVAGKVVPPAPMARRPPKPPHLPDATLLSAPERAARVLGGDAARRRVQAPRHPLNDLSESGHGKAA
jgi:hypothetical protein